MAGSSFKDYWNLRMQSATARLKAARLLIDHNPTRGSIAEAVLRDLLREFLPQRYGVGSGFMLPASGKQSRQIDVLLYDQLDSAPIYRDGDLVVISPDAAYLAMEVKSNLNSTALAEAFTNIASIKNLNSRVRGFVFGYDSAKIKTFKKHLPIQKTKHGADVPDQILCLESQLLITWDSSVSTYTGYDLAIGTNPAQQLISEILSACKVTNLQQHPLGITLKPNKKLFVV